MAGSGLSTNYQSALVATVVAVKASGGRVYAIEASNPNLVTIWIQFFDLAAADITLGTTVPKFTLAVPKGASATDVGIMDKLWVMGVDFQTAIRVAATTAPDNATAPGTGLDVNFFFQ